MLLSVLPFDLTFVLQITLFIKMWLVWLLIGFFLESFPAVVKYWVSERMTPSGLQQGERSHMYAGLTLSPRAQSHSLDHLICSWHMQLFWCCAEKWKSEGENGPKVL